MGSKITVTNYSNAFPSVLMDNPNYVSIGCLDPWLNLTPNGR